MLLRDFINIANFLGEEMTEEQATRLMDEAKDHLSISDIEILAQNCSGEFYTQVDMYNAEMGGLSRY